MAENEIALHGADPIDWNDVRFWRSVPGMERVIISLQLEEIRRRIVTAWIRRDQPTLCKHEVLDRYRKWVESPEAFDLYLHVCHTPRAPATTAPT